MHGGVGLVGGSCRAARRSCGRWLKKKKLPPWAGRLGAWSGARRAGRLRGAGRAWCGDRDGDGCGVVPGAGAGVSGPCRAEEGWGGGRRRRFFVGSCRCGGAARATTRPAAACGLLALATTTVTRDGRSRQVTPAARRKREVGPAPGLAAHGTGVGAMRLSCRGAGVSSSFRLSG